jgi:ribonuclease HII
MKNFDNSYLNIKVKLIAGIDEAGRGPLAGPVVAASVIFSPSVYIPGVNDSKLLTESKRESLFKEIKSEALVYKVSVVSHKRIDKINILNATLYAMRNSTKNLSVQPDLILVDGNRAFNYNVPVIPIVKGDSKSFAIAAASIVAKVTRDRIMKNYSKQYPDYFWEKNKGYPTRQHIDVIKLIGPSPLHRKTFLSKILNGAVQSETNLQTV